MSTNRKPGWCRRAIARIRSRLWPMGGEQLKALGQVALSIGVAALLAAASLLFMPTPELEWYGVAIRVLVLGILSLVATLVGLILHREPRDKVDTQAGAGS